MYKKEERICNHCNKTFLGIKTSKYCGYDCAKASRRKRVLLNCLECSRQFERQEWNKDAKYCSIMCKSKHQSSSIIQVVCDHCKISFDRKEHRINRGKHNFCSHTCANEFNTGSNHYEYKEYLHDKHLKLALKQWALHIKKRDNFTCQICGETTKEMLEAHHIKHRHLFPELQFDCNNGITLCLSCHAKEHIDDVKSHRLIMYKLNTLNLISP